MRMREKLAIVTKTKTALVVLVGCLMIGATPRVVAAQQYGVRAGVSGEPDQFYVGGHLETGPVVEALWFRPNLEVGFGNETTLTAVNIEFAYKVPVRPRVWHLYVGGGPALIIARHRGDTDAGGGFNLLFGAEHRGGLFAEIKAGFADSPGFKFGVGYNFSKR
jgi:hypothetical protein